MHVLVTGGTGFLGQHLVRKLLAEGHTVALMGRTMSPAQALLDAGARPLVLDLCDNVGVQAACQGMDVVIHAGALSAPWGRKADFYAINVGGTEAIIAGCLKHGVRRLIYISSPSVVFDGRDQHNAREDVPYPQRFTSTYSESKKIGEDRVRAATREGLETVIVRPKAIFGPGDQALLPRLIAAARQGRLPQIGDGQNRVDLTYVENVVHALCLALSAPAVVGKVYTITNDEHVMLWEVIRQVLQRLSLPVNLRHVSLRAVLLVASMLEARAALTGQEPLLTRYSATILARTQTYDISAAKRDLAYTPLVSIEEGIERTLSAWEERV